MAKKEELKEKEVKKGKTTKKETTNNKKVTKKEVEEKKQKKVSEKKDNNKKTTADKKKVDTKKIEKNNKEVKKEIKKEEPEKEIIVEEVVAETTEEPKKKNLLGTILVVGCIFLLCVAFVISIIETNEKNKYYKNVSFDEVVELMNKEEISIIYFGSPSCGYCSMFTPIVKEISYEEKVNFHYLNASNMNNDDYATFYTQLVNYNEVYSTEDLGTPSLILVQNGKFVSISEGYVSKSDVLEFLTTNGVLVDEENTSQE